MSRTKAFISILMALILIALSGVSVWAAPGGQEEEPTVISVVDKIEIDEETEPPTVLVTLVFVDETTNEPTGKTQTVRLSLETAGRLGLLTENGEMINQTVEIPDPDDPNKTISGEVQEIVIEVDEETGATTVLVILKDGQEVRLSLETAAALGLVAEKEDMIEQPVDIPPDEVIEVIEEDGEEGKHPVALALAASFLAEKLGLNYEDIMVYHEEDRMGFGVIAQACWMSFMLNDSDNPDAPKITPGDILEAKRDHDFDSITLSEDGEPIITLPNGEVPTNWGQFRKAVLGSEKGQKNLGAIMSGRAAGEQEQEEEEEEDVVGSSTELSGKGKDKGGKPDIPPGQVKDKDKGGGPPAEPPGKVKNKDKGKDKGGGKKQ